VLDILAAGIYAVDIAFCDNIVFLFWNR